MKRPKSDIPSGTTERLIREYEQVGPFSSRLMEYVLNDQVVGQRWYDQDGDLILETPIKDSKKHGREYRWDFDGTLMSVEPYVNGKINGLAKQYGRKGRVIGTYRMNHGTGLDVWRQEWSDGSISIAEIHSMKNGSPHGYELWFSGKHPTLWHERHWHEGNYHGIERMWNEKGKLRRGYPKYLNHGQKVTKRQYLKAAQSDKTLPPYRDKDNTPRRKFPTEIEQLLSV